MQITDFDYELPEALIAQYPLAERSASRLLHIRRGDDYRCEHRFRDLPRLLKPGDLLVLNDSKVLPARLWARKPTGARVELLLERQLGEHRMLCQVRSNRKLQLASDLLLDGGERLRLLEKRAAFVVIESLDAALVDILQQYGHVPLPPYIRRDDEPLDADRYQTVYAEAPGSVAAPTAGLHFDAQLLQHLERAGIGVARVTLHVGAGTFQPVRCGDIRRHRMHAERYSISAGAAATINCARAERRRIIAVGTTALRTLESAAQNGGQVAAGSAESRLFIYPGYRFQVIDGLITNFHLPRSTLLMLVAALAGRERVLAAYRYAVARQFRFYSYGDAMLID